MKARDTRKWRLGYAKTRSILTLFGEQRNRRHFYRNTETGETALPSVMRWIFLLGSESRTG